MGVVRLERCSRPVRVGNTRESDGPDSAYADQREVCLRVGAGLPHELHHAGVGPAVHHSRAQGFG